MIIPDVSFDVLFHRAWPADQVESAHGWMLRYTGGVTKRANSVLPSGDTDDVGAAVTAAEGFYRAHDLPTAFFIGDRAPVELDDVLAERGYRVVDPTLVMVRSLDAPDPAPSRTVVLADAPSDGWVERWWSVDGRGGAVRRGAAQRILMGVPSGYASLGGAVPDAVGRVTITDGWAGVYCMAVSPGERRRGLGGAVLRALLGWAHDRGARQAYLGVVERNAPARALYERLGFVTAVRYHYRVLD